MNRGAVSWAESASLKCAIAVPCAYFGLQMLAAPFYPDYSFLSDDASTLGSSESNAPWVFNSGTLVVGILMLASTVGLKRSLFRSGARGPMVWATLICCVAGAIGCFNAAMYPLPDPRHTMGLLANVSMVFMLLPFLLPFDTAAFALTSGSISRYSACSSRS